MRRLTGVLLLVVLAAGLPVVGPADAAPSTGASSVLGFGSAVARGSADAPVVAISATPSGEGYRLASADGGVFTYGDASFHGAAARPASPVVGMATTPSGRGYWLVASDGGVFAFGDAGFHGSTGGRHLNQPVVGMAATPTGRGYWLVARDGGVFAFGDARFHGSTGGTRLNQPIVGMAASARGYWLVARDGGVFAFGDAAFHGSGAGRLPAGHEVVGMAARPGGYWLAASAAAGVTVALAGDVHGEDEVADLLAAGGNPVAAMAPSLQAADVAAVNLETPVGTTGPPAQKEHVFQAPPSLLRALVAGGVDVVSLANNHALDHGVEGMLETLQHARAAGIATVGAGRTSREAYAPVVLGSGDRRVAVVGLSRVLPAGWAAGADRPGLASAYDVAAATAAVRAAATMADHVVVLVHWGVELAACPDDTSTALALRLVEAGADVVSGHHPHVLQPVQPVGRALVAWSLGNFVWYHNRPPSDATGVLLATLDRGGVAAHRFVPARIDRTGTPRPVSGADADAVTARTAAARCA